MIIFLRKQFNISNTYFIGFILSFLILAYRLLIQPIISVNNGQGWDGEYYYKMATDINASVPLPFRLRIGLPLLIHYIPLTDILYRFKLVNLVFGVIFSIIVYVGIAKFSKSTPTRIVSWFLICSTAISPIPFTAWYPTNSDTIPNLLLLIVLLLSLTNGHSFFSFATLFASGTIFRENFPIFICLLLLQTQTKLTPSILTFFAKSIRSNYTAILNIGGAALCSLIGFAIVYRSTGVSPLGNKVDVLRKTLSSQNLLETIAASINVYGALFIFILASYIITKHYRGVIKNRGALFLCLSILTIVSLGGGSTTERFLYWGLIITVFDALLSIDKIFLYGKPLYNMVAIIFSIIFQRLLLPISSEGIAGCGVKSYLFGNSTWIGHWVANCNHTQSLVLIGFYLTFIGLFGFLFFLGNLSTINHLDSSTDL